MTGDDSIIDKLLQAAHKGDQPTVDDVEATDYDWSTPHSLDADDRSKVGELAASAAGEVSRVLSKLLRGEITLSPGALSEKYGHDLARGAKDNPAYYLALNLGDGQPVGVVSVSASAAASWVGKLLGASSGDAGRKMSQLEVTVLGDVVHEAALAVCGAFGAVADGANLTPAEKLGSDLESLIAGDSTEYCGVAFSPADSGDDVMLTVALTGATMKAVTSGQNQAQDATAKREAVAMLEHVGATTLIASVCVGSAKASVRDLAGLEVGDVLVLQGRANDPVELLVRDVTLAKGRLAVCEGSYALQISQTAVTT